MIENESQAKRLLAGRAGKKSVITYAVPQPGRERRETINPCCCASS
jgi:hypothetical protein